MPEHLQFDTQNNCNLDCVYCNVKSSGCYRLPRGVMPTETYMAVLKHYGRKLGLYSVAPFMNGEPLLDLRLPSLVSTAKKYSGASCIIDTNGTLTQNRSMLIHPDLQLVRFTISAATRETYLEVHGKDLFHEAVNNFLWFTIHKHPNQTAWLHYIVTKQNEHEVGQWLKLFAGYGRTVFPVHRSVLQGNSEECMGERWQPRPHVVLSNGVEAVAQPSEFNRVYPCPCWAIMGVGWQGEILQCVDYPYKFNYGKVGGVDLDVAWRERVKVGFDNECCWDCSLKFKHGAELLKKYS